MKFLVVVLPKCNKKNVFDIEFNKHIFLHLTDSLYGIEVIISHGSMCYLTFTNVTARLKLKCWMQERYQSLPNQ